MIYSSLVFTLALLLSGRLGQAPAPRAAVVSPDGDFSVAMPGTPHVATIPTPLPATVITRNWSADDGVRNQYLVSWTDYGKNIAWLPARVASSAQACEALVESKGARLLDAGDASVDGKPARACTFIETDGRLTKARFVATETRFYQVMASVTSAAAATEADGFLNSFKWR